MNNNFSCKILPAFLAAALAVSACSSSETGILSEETAKEIPGREEKTIPVKMTSEDGI